MLQRVDPVSLATAKKHSLVELIAFAVMVVTLVIAPFVAYPLFLMQALCFALFALSLIHISEPTRPY